MGDFSAREQAVKSLGPFRFEYPFRITFKMEGPKSYTTILQFPIPGIGAVPLRRALLPECYVALEADNLVDKQRLTFCFDHISYDEEGRLTTVRVKANARIEVTTPLGKMTSDSQVFRKTYLVNWAEKSAILSLGEVAPSIANVEIDQEAFSLMDKIEGGEVPFIEDGLDLAEPTGKWISSG